jgi:hypothetical protein
MAYSKYNIVYHLQKWMDSVAGQTFLNYAYSWGASIVILGTLFKLTHLSGADFFLFLGMGTEVFVFFISAFDRPFDKTKDNMVLDTKTSQHQQMMAQQQNGGTNPSFGSYGYPVNDMERQLKQQLNNARDVLGQMPEGEDAQTLRDTINAITQVYRLQLDKASAQMNATTDISRELLVMTGKLKELNAVYTRMIDAVKA